MRSRTLVLLLTAFQHSALRRRWSDALPSVLATMYAAAALATITAVGQTVLIVDDHDEFRSAARDVLEAEGFTVVGEAARPPR
jgi:hypothetical protein